ncbi:hypothetical protein KQY27_03420 [Methanobrevibacter sp. TMH8]|uniref:hypothetical protein n=1 Tax=Methanobrevibacter sp. TMH8 TaxID=2848611 RepID=UPI001CC972B8|nr:hypothetical protein [Methanobrevibacter sp. TMH8]MBZ9570595.1 hypothetical protein [Methanobrevibacter sp. TMH8]
MKQIISFLENNVLSKPLFTDELLYKLDDGKLQGVYSDQITFSNLKYNSYGFNFDMFVLANEKIYELNEIGEKVNIRKDFSGVALFRYELAKRHSSNEITGTMRFISGTLNNPPAEAIVNCVYDIKFENNSLSWFEKQGLYRDQPSKDDKYTATSFDAENRIYIENNKVHFKYTGKVYDVDTQTFEKSESNAEYPHFLSKER